jgi:diguanylate cyclase (GGDEF)-like protein/PAS domain S-box-containing protein
MNALVSDVDVWEDFFDKVRIGLALADLSTCYVRVNASYATLLGRPEEDLVGVSFTDVLPVDDQPGSAADLDDLLAGRRTSVASEQRYVTPDGNEVWVLHGISLVPGADDEPGWFAVSAQDITERRRAEEELRDLTAALTERAVRDPLTGVANRTLLEERLRGTLARDARTGGTTGLLFLDLDGFKSVNDRHGHAVGDAVLRVVAERLSGVVRPSDTVARLGGDEFVVLAEGTTPEGVRALSDRLASAVGEPLQIDGLTLDVGVSVGFAVSTAGESDAASLMAASDSAMYADKRSRARA